MRKMILLIVFLFSFTIIEPVVALTLENNTQKTTPQLTEQQRMILHEKKQELREKYFSKWEEKSSEEKKEAINGFKKELEDFCRDEFGVSFNQIRKRFHRFS